MLRHPPSRISLTSSDIAAFEHRFVIRHTDHVAVRRPTTVHLSAGPAREVQQVITPAAENPTVGHSGSNTLQAIVASIDGCDQPSSASLPPLSVPQSLEGRVEHSEERPALLEDQIKKEALGPQRIITVPAPLGVSAPAVESHHLCRSNVDLESDSFTVNCIQPETVSNGGRQPSFPNRTDYGNDRVLHKEGLRYRLRMKANRLRHRHSRSLDDHLALPRRNEQRQSLTEVLDEERTSSGTDVAVIAGYQRKEVLDPQASVFLPRSHLATSNEKTSCPQQTPRIPRRPRWNSMDSTHGAASFHMRRPPPSLPVDQLQRCETGTIPPVLAGTSRHLHRPIGTECRFVPQKTFMPIVNSQSGSEEQQPDSWAYALPEPSPVLDRYPLLRPACRANLRHDDISNETIRVPCSNDLRSKFLFDKEAVWSTGSCEPRSVNAGRDRRQSGPEPLPPVRSSLLPPRHGRARSMISVASGNSNSNLFEPHSDDTGGDSLDATEEIRFNRSSPLDELTKQLSRARAYLSSQASQSSLGFSRSSPLPSPPVSLLNGDLFRPDSPIISSPQKRHHPNVLVSDSPQLAAPVSDKSIVHSTGSTTPLAQNAQFIERWVHSALIGSPNLGRNTSSNLLTRSPTRRNAELQPPSAVAERTSPTRATPRVQVFNDNMPLGNQPVTPADIDRSRARRLSAQYLQYQHRHGRSVSPASIPPRSASRQRAGSPTQRMDSPATTITPTEMDSEANPRISVTPYRSTQRFRDENAEHFEGHLRDMENERRVWLGRREDGSLDTTPPAEGRFERFLSEL